MAIDDHLRIGFMQMHAEEKKTTAVACLQATVAHFSALGALIQRVLTDIGSAYRSPGFARNTQALDIKYSFARPYCAQTSGKAERFIQPCQCKWAYAGSYLNSAKRPASLPALLASYNSRRSHSALDYQPPASRLRGCNL